MLSHEDLFTYYKNNSRMLFRLRGEFEQLITLTELEDMMPFERQAYFLLIEQRLKQREQEKARK